MLSTNLSLVCSSAGSFGGAQVLEGGAFDRSLLGPVSSSLASEWLTDLLALLMEEPLKLPFP